MYCASFQMNSLGVHIQVEFIFFMLAKKCSSTIHELFSIYYISLETNWLTTYPWFFKPFIFHSYDA